VNYGNGHEPVSQAAQRPGTGALMRLGTPARPILLIRTGFYPHPNPPPEGEGEECALSSLPSPFGRGTEGEGGGKLYVWAHLGAPAHSSQGNFALCYPLRAISGLEPPKKSAPAKPGRQNNIERNLQPRSPRNWRRGGAVIGVTQGATQGATQEWAWKG